MVSGGLIRGQSFLYLISFGVIEYVIERYRHRCLSPLGTCYPPPQSSLAIAGCLDWRRFRCWFWSGCNCEIPIITPSPAYLDPFLLLGV